MKTLIATAIIALASGSASAYDSSFDSQEYYSGADDSRLITRAESNPRELYEDGRFSAVLEEGMQGDRIGSSAGEDMDLHDEGNWPV